jgi:hypothetical protein
VSGKAQFVVNGYSLCKNCTVFCSCKNRIHAIHGNKRRMAPFPAHPEGPGLFFRPPVLPVICVEWLHGITSVLADEKMASGAAVQRT